MPSGTEADPSALLALAVPLMFGYMFGDVGQGLVIAAAGFALRQRWPMARLFIAGGLAAAGFGLLFGSVFSLHVAARLVGRAAGRSAGGADGAAGRGRACC